ncbi:hypothetical protein 7t3_0430 [Salmonella phage 7t3]|nr:hypothetical protein 7t3_0430 [Salmonella phage 7t3]
MLSPKCLYIGIYFFGTNEILCDIIDYVVQNSTKEKHL